MRSWRTRSASMMPLMPSPGRPNTTRTPQSINRSTSTSAVVCAIGVSPLHTLVQGARLLLTLEDPRDRSDELLPHRAAPPRVEPDLAAARDVRVQIAADPRGEPAVADREVHFVVVLERPIVEVRRADDRPQIVDEERLHVGHAGLVLEDAHAGLEHLAVHPAAGEPHPLLIGVAPGHDEGHLHAARHRAPDRAA